MGQMVWLRVYVVGWFRIEKEIKIGSGLGCEGGYGGKFMERRQRRSNICTLLSWNKSKS